MRNKIESGIEHMAPIIFIAMLLLPAGLIGTIVDSINGNAPIFWEYPDTTPYIGVNDQVEDFKCLYINIEGAVFEQGYEGGKDKTELISNNGSYWVYGYRVLDSGYYVVHSRDEAHIVAKVPTCPEERELQSRPAFKPMTFLMAFIVCSIFSAIAFLFGYVTSE